MMPQANTYQIGYNDGQYNVKRYLGLLSEGQKAIYHIAWGNGYRSVNPVARSSPDQFSKRQAKQEGRRAS